MPSILKARNLGKKYGDFTAVNGISFEIKEGEIFSLLGFAAVFSVIGIWRFKYESQRTKNKT